MDPNDLAALAATTFGLGRQVGMRLGQGDFQQSTVRNQGGYLSVYAVSEQALLAVIGTDTVNVARLHLRAPGWRAGSRRCSPGSRPRPDPYGGVRPGTPYPRPAGTEPRGDG